MFCNVLGWCLWKGWRNYVILEREMHHRLCQFYFSFNIGMQQIILCDKYVNVEMKEYGFMYVVVQCSEGGGSFSIIILKNYHEYELH